MTEEGAGRVDMRETDEALERLIAENKGLVLFSSAVASACHRMDRLPPEMRTAGFIVEAIGQFVGLAEPPSDLAPSTAVSDEAYAALRLLRVSLAANRSTLQGPTETVQ